MENKTKHRILGGLVVLGLVVIMLPLFEGSGDPKPEVALVNAPSFPDQAINMAANADGDTIQSIPMQISESPLSPNPDDAPSLMPSEVASPTTDIASVSAPVPSANTPAPLDASPAPSAEVAIRDLSDMPETLHDDGSQAKSIPAKPVQSVAYHEQEKPADKTHVTTRKTKTLSHAKPKQIKPDSLASIKKSVAVVDQLSKLKQSAWVIQVGSFKSKSNAMRTVNRLRSNGYTAFIQEVNTEAGNHTRVYVGPESKRQSAMKLAKDLKSDMHIEGVVINYQPLA